MSLLFLKYLHVVAVATTFALFFVRGLWLMQSYPESQEKWVRALPHIVDGVLVLSALGILITSPLKGWPGEWLTLKLLLAVVYFALVLLLFRWARTLTTKILIWLPTLVLFLYITTVAVLHHPRGIFSVL
jgi:uncharacterized membrane protein SirB2